MGLPGDSGAWVVSKETHEVYGQIWARNKYWGSGIQFAFFTPMKDLFNHIAEVTSLGMPTLPLCVAYNKELEDEKLWRAFTA